MRRLPILFVVLFLVSINAGAQVVWDHALTLTGTHPSYAVVAPNPILSPTSSMTMECWVKPTNVASPTDQAILSREATSEGYQLFLRNGVVCAGFNGLIRCRSTVPLVSGEWTHLAATFDSASGTVAVYLNGALDSSTTGNTFGIKVSTDSLFIGRAGYTTVGLFAGSIDNIRIWDHALTPAELSRDYRSIIKTSTGIYHGLLLSLPMQLEYGYSGTISDYSGRGNPTFLRGSTSWLDMRNLPSVTTTPNEAVYLDGSGYLSQTWSGYNNISGSYTLEAWVWPSVTQTSTILQKREGSNAVGYTLYLATNHPCVRTNNSTWLQSSRTIPNSQWSHIAASYDSSTGVYSLYINGVLDTQSTHAGTSPNASTDSLFIGTGFNGSFHGYLDEVRIANYPKTPDVIRTFTFCSIDNNNEPTSSKTNIVYPFDGTLMDVADISGWLAFQGSARFSHPAGLNNTPVSPLLREDDVSYPAGFWMKPSNRRIPQSTTIGMMVDDSLSVSESVTISSLRLAVLINHTAEADCKITLIGPGGDSVDVFSHSGLSGPSDNILTIFDDAAPSSLAGGYTSWTPRVRPFSPMASVFSGKTSDGIWRLRIGDNASGDTGRVYAWGLQFNNSVLVGVSERATVARELRLDQNYPNPFNPTTTISCRLPEAGDIRLAVYDILGREVQVLADGKYQAGQHSFTFSAQRLASGVYFYRLAAGGHVMTKKMTLIK